MGMKKILVVDYDQSSLASLHGVLAKEGYEVVTAADGQAGWEKFNKESPDLVLMEAMLPKVHGFELCQRITSERNSQTTVFIMTGVYKDRVYRTEALRTYGASEYFEKPLKMTEIMASIEAVLGKPEPRPEPLPDPRPVKEPRTAPVTVMPRKREKPRSDDDMFQLPADLDQLTREVPKARKPAPAHHEPAGLGFESLADELLKSVVADPAPPKKPADKTNGGNGNGHEGVDIDQFLKSALAGLDLDKEKVKAPKPAPQPEPIIAKPAVEKPAVEKPIEEPIIEKAKPIPAPHREPSFSPPVAPDRKNTLTPGDPGSDISPFFQPAKTKPEAPVESSKAFKTPAKAPEVPVAAMKPPKPTERPRPAPVKPEPSKAEPVRKEPVKPEPVKLDVRIPEIEPTPSGDIFGHGDIFGKAEPEERTKKGFPTLLGIGIAVAAVAVAAFLVFRPKPAPRVDDSVRPPQTASQQALPVQTVEEPPPPVVKPEPAKTKPKPAAKKAEPEEDVIEGIVTPLAPSAPPLGADDTAGSGNADLSSQPPSTKTEGTAPPVKGEADGVQDAGAGAAAAAAPAAAVETPPAGPPAKEGDLVDLASVDTPPNLLKRVNPVYPQLAQQRGVEGTITVNALIDEKGVVIETAILKGIQDDKGLGRAAETAVKKWKFEPARKGGVAVKVWKSFLIAFKAEKGGSGAPN
jgi:TonB family protein